MKIFIAGGTGFVGSYLIAELLKRGHNIRLLVRNTSRFPKSEGVETVSGDLLHPESIAGKTADCDAVINLVGIIREFPARGITYERFHFEAVKNLAYEAERSGVSRWVQMSANGARMNGVSNYQSSKARGEEFLLSTRLSLTIFRPSLIFGKPPAGATEFCTQMLGVLKSSPVAVLFGNGRYEMQPVHVTDVAKVFSLAVENGSTGRTVYHLGGRYRFSYRALLDLICDGADINRRIKLPVPYSLVRPVVSLLGRFSHFPATVDQTDMLVEGNVVPETDYIESFGVEPLRFSRENITYLKGE